VKLFRLDRDIDISGVSGVGTVAQGVEFDDGTTVVRWLGSTPTTTIHANMASVEKIHGHMGYTRIVEL
jgi:hypothetical protein